ncbi:unnamed protein product, partial [Tetraodon nigroviridis]
STCCLPSASSSSTNGSMCIMASPI